MSRSWVLYGREGCHLCEEASALLEAAGLSQCVEYRDISSDPELEAEYGLRIPVLHDPDRGRELDWPFGLQTLLDWQL